MRLVEAVVAGHLDHPAAPLAKPLFGGRHQHPPDALLSGLFSDDEDRDPPNRQLPVDRDHPVDSDQADDILLQSCDQLRNLILGKRRHTLADAFRIDVMAEQRHQFDQLRRIRGPGLANLRLRRDWRLGIAIVGRLALRFLALAQFHRNIERRSPILGAEIAQIVLNRVGRGAGAALLVEAEQRFPLGIADRQLAVEPLLRGPDARANQLQPAVTGHFGKFVSA